MQIVIDIDEDVFTRLFDNGTEDDEIMNDDLFAIANSIRSGTPLPEHHGDLIDRNEFIKNLRDSKKGFWRKKFFVNGEATMESMAYEINDIKKMLNDAPTIIEGSEC